MARQGSPAEAAAEAHYRAQQEYDNVLELLAQIAALVTALVTLVTVIRKS